MITDSRFLSIEELVEFEIANTVDPSVLYSFQNEEQALVSYLQSKAYVESTKDIGKTWLYIKNDFSKVHGFYTVSTASLERSDIRGQHPYPMISAVIIGRLARDISAKGTGVGETLVLHAFESIVEASKRVGIKIILVDAKNEAAKNFYAKFGFKKIKSSVDGIYPARLYISVETVRAVLG